MTSSSDIREETAARAIEEGRYVDAFKEYTALARDGSTIAAIRLGWMYETGKGVDSSVRDAELWYHQAATAGSAYAEFYLANWYRRIQRYDHAVEWLEKSASQGYPPAIYALGVLHRFGAGVPVSNTKALAYFDEAAGKGHVFAMREVALDMIRGRRGIRHIAGGFLMLVKAFWTAVKVARREPQSDLVLR